MHDLAGFLNVERFRFIFSTRGKLQIPPFAGSLWRSAFGNGLRKTVCITNASSCDSCSMKAGCLYSLFFEDGHRLLPARYTAPPRPFVLEPQPTQEIVQQNARILLDIVLIGPAINDITTIHEAIRFTGEQGLGKQRTPLLLQEVQQQVMRDSEQTWLTLSLGDDVLAAPFASNRGVPQMPRRLRLELLTPLRLKWHGHLVSAEQFTVELFLDALHRRIGILNSIYAESTTFNSEPGSSDSPSAAIACHRQLRWQDQPRWSQRQHSTMKMGGILGEVEFSTETIEAYWPALWLGQWLHVGNGATFGLGKYRLSAPLDG